MPEVGDPKLLGITAEPKIDIPIEKLDAPGAPMFIHVVPRFEGNDTDPSTAITDTTIRKFIVSGRLAKEPSSVEVTGAINAAFSKDDGDCYLALPPHASSLRIDTQWGIFRIEPNSAGNFGIAVLECNASDPLAARQRFIEAVYPAIDHWSYTYNVAIFISTIRVFDVLHKSTRITFSSPYHRHTLDDSEHKLFIEMKPIYSMYREAKNTSSDFYRFLCLYKIMEGLFGPMRDKIFIQLQAAGIVPSKNRVNVPDSPNFPVDLKPYTGKSMKRFFDDILTRKFRNAVAHLGTPIGVLDVSSPAELDRYAGIAFATDLCTRVLINSHEQLLLLLQGSQPNALPGA